MNIEFLRSKIPQLTDIRLLNVLASSGSQMSFRAGESIVDPGQFIKLIPIVLEGLIKVIRTDESGKELFLYYLEPGQTCALSLTCCSASRPSEIKALAEEETMILGVPIDLHEKWMDEYRQWKEYVSSTYQSRFQELLETLDAVAFKRLDQRLMRYLSTKLKQQKATELQMSHQEIATEMGTSREVISRLLKQLEKRRWIELGRNVIYLRDDFEELVAKED
jgi:CRP/FNR family transcriptional regulator